MIRWIYALVVGVAVAYDVHHLPNGDKVKLRNRTCSLFLIRYLFFCPPQSLHCGVYSFSRPWSGHLQKHVSTLPETVQGMFRTFVLCGN